MQHIEVQFKLMDETLIFINDKKKAIKFYQENTEHIIKISFGNFRFVKKTKQHKWMDESETVLNMKSKQYKNCKDNNAIFWVYQHLRPQDETIKQQAIKLQQEGDDDGSDKLWYPNLIVSVYDNSQFNEFLKSECGKKHKFLNFCYDDTKLNCTSRDSLYY